MPHVVRSPITVKVGDEIRRYSYGDVVPDEVASELRETHAHALNPVAHSALLCGKDCTHYSHPWNQEQPADKTALRRVPATKTEAAE